MAFDAKVEIAEGSYVEWWPGPHRGIVRSYMGKRSHSELGEGMTAGPWAFKAPAEDVYQVEFRLNGRLDAWGCWRSDLKVLDPLA